MGSKEKNVIQRVIRYVRHDLREILAPSSLPDPPDYVYPPKKSLGQHLTILKEAVRIYIDSWDGAKMEAELRRERGEDEATSRQREGEAAEEMRELAEEVKKTATGGAASLAPYLQHLYKTRAKAYRDAVKQFIEGYKEGFQEANQPEVPPEVAAEMKVTAAAAEEEEEKKKAAPKAEKPRGRRKAVAANEEAPPPPPG